MPADVFEKEAEGLKALASTGKARTPEVVDVGVHERTEYLVLKYIDSNGPRPRWNFGTELAELHRIEQPHFGWSASNYIGSLNQVNTPCDTWEEFFIQHRLNPRVKKLRDAHSIGSADVTAFNRLASVYAERIPRESPSMLHGDLWSGNVIVDLDKSTWLIDPAVYCGHREMDLAMMQLFGGFDDEVYDFYHEVYPLEPGFENRVRLHQLYPILVHAELFGGHYVKEAVRIARTYA